MKLILRSGLLAVLVGVQAWVAQATEFRFQDPAQELPRVWTGEYSSPGVRMPMHLEFTDLQVIQRPARGIQEVWRLQAQGSVAIGTETYPLQELQMVRTDVIGTSGVYEVVLKFDHEFAVTLFGTLRKEGNRWTLRDFARGGWRSWVLEAR